MELITSNILFEIYGAKIIHKQKVKVKPIAHHYEASGEPEYIKYGCPLCEILEANYIENYFDEEEPFKKFSFPEGTSNCPCCGINFDWN